MSKLEALKNDLATLDGLSAPSPTLRSLLDAEAGCERTIEDLDDRHCERVEALQNLIKAEQAQHKTNRDSYSAELARTRRMIDDEKKIDEPKQRELASMAQEIAKKYGKPLPELRQLLVDMGES